MNGLLTLPMWYENGGCLIYYIACLWKRFCTYRETNFSLFLIKFVPLYSNLDGLNVIRKISWILVILFYIFLSFAILCLLLFHCNVFLFIFPNLRDLSITFLPYFVSHSCSHTNAHSLLSHQLKEMRILWRFRFHFKLAIQQTDEILIEFYIWYPFLLHPSISLYKRILFIWMRGLIFILLMFESNQFQFLRISPMYSCS